MSVKEKEPVEPGQRFGKLETRWSWKSGDERIWKCVCRCGNYCYVKESALLNKVVRNCGNIKLHKPIKVIISCCIIVLHSYANMHTFVL